ncbi:MAG: ABC transporter permease [Vicinamibacterales bacterium]
MGLASQLRHGFRTMTRQPGLSLMAVLALTLGIGLTTTMFSIIQGAFLRGLPVPDADRIMAVAALETTQQDDQDQGVFQHDFAEWRDAQQSFEVFAAFYGGTINISNPDGEGRAERYDGAFMTANAFEVIRATAALGRTFAPGDDAPGAPGVVVLGHDAWQNRFGGDPDIVGRTTRVNGRAATVIGVMPEGFKFPNAVQVWVPLPLDVLRTARGQGTSVVVFGRLAPGVTIDRAQAEFQGLARRQAEAYPETNEHRTADVRPFIRNFLGRQIFATMLTMLAAVFGVMLIACANVANLLIARTAVRSREIAIRTALGASRRRVIGQLLAESFVLAAAGTAGGLILAQAGLVLFNRSIVDTNPPFWIDIRLDPTVLLFTAALTAIATMAAGLLPAVQASRSDVNAVLKDESRGSSGLRVGILSRVLVVAEIAISCGLLVASGLAIKSVVTLRTADFGFATDDVFTARMGLFEADYPDDASRARFYADLRERAAALPGALAATVATNLPSTGAGRQTIAVEGRTYATERDYPSVRYTAVSPGFFDTFDRALLRGRDFSVADDGAAPRVAIVNASFAAKYFPAEDPVGRHFRAGRPGDDAPWITVIGVVPDMYLGSLTDERPDGYYVPLAQEPPKFASLAIRTAGAPMTLAAAVRREVEGLDSDLPLYWVRTMTAYIESNNWFYSVFGSLFMAFGAAALFLATVGLYAVMAFSVSRRTQEFGVRMALGSSGGGVVRLVLRQGLVQIGLGLVLGVLLAAALSLGITTVIFGVEPWDPAVFAAVVGSLAAAALAACLVPAVRAMRVPPHIALRGQ